MKRVLCGEGPFRGDHSVEVLADGTLAFHYRVPGQTDVCEGSGTRYTHQRDVSLTPQVLRPTNAPTVAYVSDYPVESVL